MVCCMLYGYKTLQHTPFNPPVLLDRAVQLYGVGSEEHFASKDFKLYHHTLIFDILKQRQHNCNKRERTKEDIQVIVMVIYTT
jgi:hypothetical protein